MKALFIGGTGVISTSITNLAIQKGWELYLLNRGNHPEAIPEGAKVIRADINDESSVTKLVADMDFDVIADFIAYLPAHIKRDLRLFGQKTSQYIFISSASAYQKPPLYYKITESTPLYNPFWKYSRDKIACEDLLIDEQQRFSCDNYPPKPYL